MFFFYYLLIFKAWIWSKLTSLLVAFWRCRINKGMLDHEACRQLYFVMEHTKKYWLCYIWYLEPYLTKTHIWWKLYRWRWRWSSIWANGEYEQRCRCVRSPNCHFYGDAPQLCYWISGGHRFSDNALGGEDDHDHRCVVVSSLFTPELLEV